MPETSIKAEDEMAIAAQPQDDDLTQQIAERKREVEKLEQKVIKQRQRIEELQHMIAAAEQLRVETHQKRIDSQKRAESTKEKLRALNEAMELLEMAPKLYKEWEPCFTRLEKIKAFAVQADEILKPLEEKAKLMDG